MASTIDPTLNGDMTADGRAVNKSELQQQFTAAAADIVDLQGATLTAGAGIAGIETFASGDDLIVTRLVIDLTGLVGSATDLDIIGDSAAASANFGQITAAGAGTLVGGKVTCLETPAGGSDDIDFYSATEATGTEDAAVTGLTETALLTSGGAWASGTVKGMTALPAADEYLYVVNGEAAGGTYTAGKFLIELYGTA